MCHLILEYEVVFVSNWQSILTNCKKKKNIKKKNASKLD